MKKNKKGRKRLKDSEKRVLVHVYIQKKYKKQFLKRMIDEAIRMQHDGITDSK